MNALVVGPFAFALDRVVVVLAIVVALGVARWTAGPRRGALESILLWSGAVGAIVARLTYVASHWSAYALESWRALWFWEDGYVWTTGAMAAVLAATELARRRGFTLRLVLAPLVVGVAAWFIADFTLQSMQAPPPRFLPAAQTVERLDGGSQPLRQYLGRPVVVNVWATWCPPCRREMPALAAAQQARADIHFLFLNAGEDTTTIRGYLETSRLPLRNVLVGSSSTAFSAFITGAVPTTLFFDAEGRLVARHLGALSRAKLDEYLDRLDTPAS